MTDHPVFSNDPPHGGDHEEEEEEEEEVSEAEEEEDVEGEEEEEEDDDESLVSESWISNFCSVIGHEYFAEVTEEFIEDDFNLTGLSAIVPMYKEALEMILDVEPDDSSEEASEVDLESDTYNNGAAARKKAQRLGASGAGNIALIESSAELLYGLVHQRYILSRPGMQQMYEKYLAAHFGHCPRVFCNNARVLPCGSTDTPNMDTVKLFCPCCLDIYTPPNSRFQQVDGAFFGTSFASLFLMTFTDIDYSAPSHKTPAQIPPSARKAGTTSTTAPTVASNGTPLPPQPGNLNGFATQNIAPGLGTGKQYEMKIYGFKVSERSKSGPRMKWLRSRPEDMNLVDEATRAELRRSGRLRKKKKSRPPVKDEDGMDVSPGPQESTEQRRAVKKPVRRIKEEVGTTR
ncbi:casein kinase 2 regulatory subunit [Orbilia ellipsospora]|uniref:Casein kinase II subunit beta n=1 Tax=Orbilia ellipsospora TaxID=2528407 RepID=A0AAV9WZC3_9PEZI